MSHADRIREYEQQIERLDYEAEVGYEQQDFEFAHQCERAIRDLKDAIEQEHIEMLAEEDNR